MNGSTPLLTIQEIALRLNVPVKTIYYWVHRREIPYLKVGKHLRFDEEKVIQCFESKATERRPIAAWQVQRGPLESPTVSWSLTTGARTMAGPIRKG